MIKFIHISDMHWHSKREDNYQQLKVVQSLRKYQDTHVILDTGDITDDGVLAQYLNVRDAMKCFRWLFVPGNHDHGYAGVRWSEECAKRFDSLLAKPFLTGNFFGKSKLLVIDLQDEEETKVRVFLLNSVLETESIMDFACGKVEDNQLKLLSHYLTNMEFSGVKIVLLHHHPWTHINPFMKLHDARRLLLRLRAQVDILLFGHRHVAGVYYWKWGIPWLLAAPSTPESMWAYEVSVKGLRDYSVSCIKF